MSVLLLRNGPAHQSVHSNNIFSEQQTSLPWLPEWSKGVDSSSTVFVRVGSNPTSRTFLLFCKIASHTNLQICQVLAKPDALLFGCLYIYNICKQFILFSSPTLQSFCRINELRGWVWSSSIGMRDINIKRCMILTCTLPDSLNHPCNGYESTSNFVTSFCFGSNI